VSETEPSHADDVARVVRRRGIERSIERHPQSAIVQPEEEDTPDDGSDGEDDGG